MADTKVEDDDEKKKGFKQLFSKSLKLISERKGDSDDESAKKKDMVSPRSRKMSPEDAMISPRKRSESKSSVRKESNAEIVRQKKEESKEGALSPRRQRSESKSEISRDKKDKVSAEEPVSPRSRAAKESKETASSSLAGLLSPRAEQQLQDKETKRSSKASDSERSIGTRSEEKKQRRRTKNSGSERSTGREPTSEDEDMTAPSESLDESDRSESDACCDCRSDVKLLLRRVAQLEKQIASGGPSRGADLNPASTMDEMIKLRKCSRPGCGKMFQFIANTHDVCRFHHGQWVDGYPKGYWSCCKKKDRAGVGCTSGVHAA